MIHYCSKPDARQWTLMREDTLTKTNDALCGKFLAKTRSGTNIE